MANNKLKCFFASIFDSPMAHIAFTSMRFQFALAMTVSVTVQTYALEAGRR